MKWFTNLQAKWRIVITVAAWVIVFAFCGAIGGSIGENGENMQVWQAIIFIILLAVSIVFTVFTVKAANQEKKDKAAQKAEQNAIKCTPPSNLHKILLHSRTAKHLNTAHLPMTGHCLFTQRLLA